MLSLLVAGCSSSGSAVDSASGPAPEMSGPHMLLSDAEGLARVPVSGGNRMSVQPGAPFAGLYQPSSMGGNVVMTVRGGSATQLVLMTPDGSLNTIHEHDGNAEYTVAWSPEGDLAFGFAASNGRGIGIFGRDGKVVDVGCSSSSRALGWMSSDRLVVGDANNYYVVASAGCATISRLDARKMHETAFNPKRPTMAFVLRELEYDRNARQYVPDSSLHVAGVDGSDSQLIAGSRYSPRRPSWSPDGQELAFDARIPNQPGRRLISIYNVEQGSSAFLNPSAVESSVTEWDAHWSPGGAHIAYMQRIGHGEPDLIIRPMDGSFTALVGESGERFARWIDGKYIVVSNGFVERAVSIEDQKSISAPDGTTILGIE